ncbi:MAG: nuclear transport factor 2 family protein [Solirubrobacterales bacterium]
MSEENVEIVRAGNEAWNRADMDALRELQDPDVVVRPVPNWPERGPYIGRDAAIRFYQGMRDAFDADRLEEIGDVAFAGDQVVVRYAWDVMGHGPDVKFEVSAFYSVRNGKVRSTEFFWDHAEALRAAGLSA